MKNLSITEAAKLVGVSRQTIYNKVSNGEMSKMSNGKIDVSELLRVFPDVKGFDSFTDESKEPSSVVKGEALEIENDYLKRLLDERSNTIDTLTERIDELKERIDDFRAENNALKNEIERLKIYHLPNKKGILGWLK